MPRNKSEKAIPLPAAPAKRKPIRFVNFTVGEKVVFRVPAHTASTHDYAKKQK